MKKLAELTQEAQCAEEGIYSLRRRIWAGEDVTTREVVDTGMLVLDYLCKMSSRIEKERDQQVQAWLQSTRRSLRAQLREFWNDALEKRRDIREAAPVLAQTSGWPGHLSRRSRTTLRTGCT